MLKRGAKAMLEALIPSTCAACDAPAPQALFCPPCEATLVPLAPESHAVYEYGEALQRAIVQAKFTPDAGRAQQLATLFAQEAVLPPSLDALVAVPCPKMRLLKRGFDLPALLAGALAKKHALAMSDVLKLTRSDPPLSKGSNRRERAQRVHGRYQVKRLLNDMHLLLVDDVTTTGATLGEATEVLRTAGATVHTLVLAKTLLENAE